MIRHFNYFSWTILIKKLHFHLFSYFRFFFLLQATELFFSTDRKHGAVVYYLLVRKYVCALHNCNGSCADKEINRITGGKVFGVFFFLKGNNKFTWNIHDITPYCVINRIIYGYPHRALSLSPLNSMTTGAGMSQ